MNILWTILYLLIAVVITIALITLGRKYVFSKFKVNKWIILGIAAVLFIAEVVAKPSSPIATLLFMIPIIWFFLWFMEINSGVSIKSKEKKVVIKSKAKPNRAKHLNKDKK